MNEEVKVEEGCFIMKSENSTPCSSINDTDEEEEEMGRFISIDETSLKNELHLFDSNLRCLSILADEYPELKLLVAIRQPIITLKGINKLQNIEELWIIESELWDVEDLFDCPKNIVRLFLYSNKIEKFPCVSHLKYLTKLWLSGNKLTNIENIKELSWLEDLNLASNRISKIGSSFKNLTNLKKLNLSDNPLSRLKDVTNLRMNSQLYDLELGDPMYGCCPVVELCNYRAFIIQHVNQIHILDTFVITNDERESVQEYFKEKNISYNILYRSCGDKCYLKKREKAKNEQVMLSSYRKNFYIYRLIEIQLKNLLRKDVDEIYKQKYELKYNHLKLSFKKWLKEIVVDEIKEESSLKLMEIKLRIELESCGNITFQTSDDQESILVANTIMNKFTCNKLRNYKGISGVRVLRVTHLFNKPLQLSKNWYLRHEEDEFHDWRWCLLYEAFDSNNPLMYPISILTHGFSNMKQVVFGNCLAGADRAFLDKLLCTSGWESAVRNSRTCLLVQTTQESLIYKIVEDVCDETQNHICRTAIVKNDKLAMPVCLIEFEYIFEENRLEDFRNSMGWKCNIHEDNSEPPSCLPKIEHLTLQKVIERRITLPEHILDIDFAGYQIKQLGDLSSLTSLTDVDLSYNKLETLDPLFFLNSLKKLNLSFNNIEKWPKKKRMIHLEELNLSWNLLNNLNELLFLLMLSTPELRILDLRFNGGLDIRETRRSAALAERRLSNLQHFNGRPLKIWLQRMALPDLSTFEEQKQLEENELQKSSNPLAFIWNLDPKTWEDQYLQLGEKRAEISNRAFTTGIWVALGSSLSSEYDPKKKTSLDINGLKIIGLSHTIQGRNLIRFHAAKNLLTSMNFVNRMPVLEELNLAYNALHYLGGNPFRNNENLVRLDLSCNFLRDISPLEKSNLPSLKVLDISSNLLETLQGLAGLTSIVELYAADNRIAKIESATKISGFEHLRILDLELNPLQSSEKYRAYFVFNFKSLEYLDGIAIEEAELRLSAQTFGQTLNQKFLLEGMKKKEFLMITSLSLVNCSIRKLVLEKDELPNVKFVDLSHNEISIVSCLDAMPRLETFLLSHNQVAHISPKNFPLHKLTTLFLDNNQITSLNSLHLGIIAPELRSLFVFENCLADTSGLNGLSKLEYLLLDRNRIVSATKDDFTFVPLLKELYLSANKLHFLYFLKGLSNLEKLFICRNRISDKDQLRHLSNLRNLEELSLYGNPVSHITRNHYVLLLEVAPWVKKVDGYKLSESGASFYLPTGPNQSSPKTPSNQFSPKPPKESIFF